MRILRKLNNTPANFSGFVFLAALVSMLIWPNTPYGQLRAQSYEPKTILDKKTTITEEQRLKRSLAIDEKALGPDHPNVATTLNNLGLLYSDQARYDEAEPLLKRSLSIREKTLGPDHPNVAKTLNSLAVLYSDQDEHLKALPFAQKATAIYRRRGKTRSASKSIV